jgi:hypothetical protein
VADYQQGSPSSSLGVVMSSLRTRREEEESVCRRRTKVSR